MSPLTLGFLLFTLKKVKLGFEQGGQIKEDDDVAAAAAAAAAAIAEEDDDEEQEEWIMDGHLAQMRRALGGGGDGS